MAIARGLIHKPKIVLADEPTAALDEKSGREAVTLFREMADRDGSTILIVTHDNRILDVADRIINMVDGHIKNDSDVRETEVICEFLRKTEFFTDLTPRTLADLANNIGVKTFDVGDRIVAKGEEGKEFFMIKEGRVEVVLEQGKPDDERIFLDTGAYFGEIALIKDQPRNADVIAAEPTACYVLDRKEFRQVVDTSDSFESELRKALFERT